MLSGAARCWFTTSPCRLTYLVAWRDSLRQASGEPASRRDARVGVVVGGVARRVDRRLINASPFLATRPRPVDRRARRSRCWFIRYMRHHHSLLQHHLHHPPLACLPTLPRPYILPHRRDTPRSPPLIGPSYYDIQDTTTSLSGKYNINLITTINHPRHGLPTLYP